MSGYIGHTDHGWWDFLHARPEIREVNFWRPGGGRRFTALAAGEPFFFRLKSPINQIGGFGLFARYGALPVWHAWEVFGEANGVASEAELIERCARLAHRRVGIADAIGCIAVAECIFFAPDEFVAVPPSFNPQNLSGSRIDLHAPDGRRLWSECLERSQVQAPTEWVAEATERARHGQPQIVSPRLGQGSFRLAVIDAYRGACTVTGEHSLPALEAAHIRPWHKGGTHELHNGLLLRRDLHRLFDLGYVSARPDGRFLVSPRLRTEFENGRTYYALEGHSLRAPADSAAAPDPQLLEWHSNEIFQAA
jgi:putative restriction endonuclease